jgi:TIGR02436 family protein
VTRDKAFRFAVRIVNMYKVLCERKEYVPLSKNKCCVSGTAVGALLKEAGYAQSTADFVSKVSIALKEANETEYRIMLLYETKYIGRRV